MKQVTYEADFLNKFIGKFNDISNLTEEDKEKKCTYYCDNGGDEVGFAQDVYFYDMGYTCLIAQKYITQDKLEELIKEEKEMNLEIKLNIDKKTQDRIQELNMLPSEYVNMLIDKDINSIIKIDDDFYSQSSSCKLDIFERWRYSHHPIEGNKNLL